jgi:hypothetical protein
MQFEIIYQTSFGGILSGKNRTLKRIFSENKKLAKFRLTFIFR